MRLAAVGMILLLTSLPAAAELHGPSGEVSFGLPVLWNGYAALPYDFRPGTLAPPLYLGGELDPLLGWRVFHFWLEPGFFFYRSNFAPVIDVAQGVGWRLEHFHFEVGLELCDQETLANGPLHHSQFDAFLTEPLARVSWMPGGPWELGLAAKLILDNSPSIRAYEGIDTRVSHQATTALAATARYLPIDELRLAGALRIYGFGKTAISSDQFTIGSDGQVVPRLDLEATWLGFAPFEAGVRGRFVLGAVGDELEESYRAISLNDDFLQSPVVVEARVGWRF